MKNDNENIFTIYGTTAIPCNHEPPSPSHTNSTSCNQSHTNTNNFLDVEANSICGTSDTCDYNSATVNSRTTASWLVDMQASKKPSNNSIGQTLKSGLSFFNYCGSSTDGSDSPSNSRAGNGCAYVKRSILNALPLIKILFFSDYSWKKDFPADCIAGFTIAIIQIVQGIAYALLVGTDAIIGLYTSFFPALFYSFFGTSHHLSLGTMAVVDIMIRDIVKKYTANYEEMWNATITTTTTTTTVATSLLTSTFSSVTTETAQFGSSESHLATSESSMAAGAASNVPSTLEIITALSLLVGLIQIAFGIFRIGFVSLVFSDQLVSGFSCGASISVVMSQVPSVFQLDGIGKEGGPLSLVFQLIQIVSSLPYSSIAAVIISAIVAIVSIVYRDWIDGKIKHKLPFPFPIDLLIVVLVTLISYLVKVDKKFSVRVMGEIPTGLPLPSIPRVSLFSELILEAIILAFVIYSICLSLGKIYAKKLSYEIRPNQEFIALGISNALSSFFSCFPAAGSLSRSSVMGQYGKSHMASIISCFILLFVILFLSPLLFYLPKCAVAIIIILSQRSLLMQVTDLRAAWIVSKWEGLIWLVTFTSVILLGIDYGLLIGIAFSIFTIVLRFVNPKLRRMGQLSDTGIFLDVDHHSGLQELNGIRILQFSSPLFFLNREIFKKRVIKLTTGTKNDLPNDQDESAIKAHGQGKLKSGNCLRNNGVVKNGSNCNCSTDAHSLPGKWQQLDDEKEEDEDIKCSCNSISQRDKFPSEPVDLHRKSRLNGHSDESKSPLHTVIIDCTSMAFIDSAGVATLAEASTELQARGISVVIASCSPSVLFTLSKCNFFEKSPQTLIEPSVTSAIHNLTNGLAHQAHQVTSINSDLNHSLPTVTSQGLNN